MTAPVNNYVIDNDVAPLHWRCRMDSMSKYRKYRTVGIRYQTYRSIAIPLSIGIELSQVSRYFDISNIEPALTMNCLKITDQFPKSTRMILTNITWQIHWFCLNNLYECLTWKPHIDNVTYVIAHNVGMLNRLKHYSYLNCENYYLVCFNYITSTILYSIMDSFVYK